MDRTEYLIVTNVLKYLSLVLHFHKQKDCYDFENLVDWIIDMPGHLGIAIRLLFSPMG